MSNPEEYHQSVVETFLRGEIAELFNKHVFEVGIDLDIDNLDDLDHTTDIVLGGTC